LNSRAQIQKHSRNISLDTGVRSVIEHRRQADCDVIRWLGRKVAESRIRGARASERRKRGDDENFEIEFGGRARHGSG
jgi:hypothetical protein